MSGAAVAGLDGCRGGWVVVTAAADGTGDTGVRRITDLRSVLEALDAGELAAAAIDIPIGLPDTGPRACDVEARRMLGARRSSVFPAPVRGLLGAASYEEASSRSRARTGKGLSRQAFAILPKVAEVDEVMTPDRQDHLVEVHPEVSFAVLRGGPMAYPKKTPAGHGERLRILRGVFTDVDDHLARRPAGVARDDVLDAFIAAWSAGRWLAGTFQRLGGTELDAKGLRMEMIA